MKRRPAREAIRQLRQERGLTVQQLAEKVEISRRHLYNIELGYNGARIEVLYRIANELGVPIEDVSVPADPAAAAS